MPPVKGMTPKQRAFCDYYIETGNATLAAVKAGYSKKTSAAIGKENLHKPLLAAYIKERLDAIEEGRIAKADEVMRFYSSVMRGDVKDQFGLDAQLADRLTAGKELMKRYERIETRDADELLFKAKEILAGSHSVIE